MDFIATVIAPRQIMSCLSTSIEQADMVSDYVGRMKVGTQVKCSIKRIGKPGTLQQLRCHFGLVVSTIKRTFDDRGIDLATFLHSKTIPEGIPVPEDIIHAVLYAVANNVGDNGERKTLSKMDTVERSRFFEKCRTHAASSWNIQIPDPSVTWKETRKCQQ